MKIFTNCIFLLIALFSLSVYSQKKIWLDVDLKETDKINSVYYKVISEDKKKENYFYKSGNIFRKLNYSKRRPIDNFVEFYETGELKISGKFENDLKEGIWKIYYKNGKIKEKGKYKNDDKVGIWKSYYKNF
jgi:antitoxin component YwqK of YwqJK toxin-antitoxin module